MGKKICGQCGDMLPFSAFSEGDAKYGLRWACKPCRSSGFTRKQLEKKIELFPNLYVDCDNCDYINTRTKDFRSIYKPRELRTHCKRCGHKLEE